MQDRGDRAFGNGRQNAFRRRTLDTHQPAGAKTEIRLPGHFLPALHARVDVRPEPREEQDLHLKDVDQFVDIADGPQRAQIIEQQLINLAAGLFRGHDDIDQFQRVLSGHVAPVIFADGEKICFKVALADQMQVRAAVLIVNDVVDGEFVEITAEFARIAADAFEDPLDLAVILRKKGGDAAGFAEVETLENDGFGFEDHFSRKW